MATPAALQELAWNISSDPSWLIDSEHWQTALTAAKKLDPTATHVDIFCRDIGTALKKTSVAVQQSDDPSTVEVFKKLFRISHFVLSQLATKIGDFAREEFSRARLTDADSRKYVTVAKSDTMLGFFNSVEIILKGIDSGIKVGYSPLGHDEEECQLLSDQYIGTVFKFFEMPVTPYSRICDSLFSTLGLSADLHQQTQNIQSRLVSAMCYNPVSVDLCLKLLTRLVKEENFQVPNAVTKGFLSSQLNSSDENYKGQLDSLCRFIEEAAESAPILLVHARTLLVDMHEEPEHRLRAVMMKALKPVLRYMLDTAGEENNNEEFVKETLDKLRRHHEDAHFTVRINYLKLLRDLHQEARAFFSRHQNLRITNEIVTMTSLRMDDNSAFVRHHALELFCQIILHNPFVEDPYQEEREGESAPARHLNSELFKRNESVVAQKIAILEAKVAEVMKDVDETELPEDVVVFEQEKARLQLHQLWLQDAITFSEKVDRVVHFATSLLNNPQIKSLEGTIDLIMHADSLNVVGAHSGLIRMLHLVWFKTPDLDPEANNSAPPQRKEQDLVTRKLLESFELAWFKTDPLLSKQESGGVIAKTLLHLVNEVHYSELMSLERLLKLYTGYSETFTWDHVAAQLWRYVGIRDRPEVRDNAVIALSMLSSIDSKYADMGLQQLIKRGLTTKNRRVNYNLAKYSCKIIQNMSPEVLVDTDILPRLKGLLLLPAHSLEWFGFAHEAVHAMVKLSSTDALVELLTSTSGRAFKTVRRAHGDHNVSTASQDVPNDAEALESQLLFFQLIYLVGEALLHVLIKLDECIVEFKRNARDESNEKQDELTAAVQNTNQAEMKFTTMMAAVKNNLLYHDQGIFHKFTDLIRELCGEILETDNMILDADSTVHGADRFSPFAQVACVTALAKFMSAHETYCTENSALLLALLDSCRSDDIRSTLVIALGDLSVLHSHAMELNTPALFEKLQDKSGAVQRTAVVTLTFLILGGKVKVRGNLGYMARLIKHPDPKIEEHAQRFFIEYAQKDKELFNSFMDILSTLEQSEELRGQRLNETLNFLCLLLQRKTEREKLLEKLLPKLKRCDSQRVWDVYSTACKKLLPKDTGKEAEEGSNEATLRELIKKGFVDTKSQNISQIEYEEESDEEEDEEVPLRDKRRSRSPEKANKKAKRMSIRF